MENQTTKSNMPAAIILAGGRGVRLRPLTLTTPKPLLPLGGVPVISRLLAALGASGVKNVGVATGYMAEKLEKKIGASDHGVTINYFHEQEGKTLGTAGAVKAAAAFINGADGGDFFVICGDAYIELDWRAAYDFHRHNGGLATVILKRVDEPLEFGVAITENGGSGRITSFMEKPSWDRVATDTVNCGIYIFKKEILNFIPEGKYDFGSQLFGALLDKGESVYGFVTEGEWCDVGNPESFYNCNMYLAEKENPHVGGVLSLFKRGVGVVDPTAVIDPSAHITESVVFDNVRVGADARIERAIICEGTKIGERAQIFPGAVIGAEAVIAPDAVVPPQTVVAPGTSYNSNIKTTDKKERKMKKGHKENIFTARDMHFGDYKLLYTLSELSAPRAVALGQALAYAVHSCAETGVEPQIGVLFCAIDGQEKEGIECVRKCMITGLASVSERIRVIDYGAGFPSLAAFAAKRFGHELTLCMCGNDGDRVSIYLYDKYGLYPDRGFERALSDATNSGVNASASEWREPDKNGVDGGKSKLVSLYRSYLGELSRGSFNGLLISCESKNAASEIAVSTLGELGAAVGETAEIYFNISEEGDNLTITQEELTFDFWHLRGVIIADLIARRAASVISLPYRAPETLHNLVEQSPVPLRKFSLSALDKEEARARESAAREYWLFDAVAALIMICDITISTKKSVAELCDELPIFAEVEGDTVDITEDRAAALRKFGSPADEGVAVNFDIGRVRMIAKRRAGFSLMAEAATESDAATLIERAKKRLGKLMKKNKKDK